MIADPFTGWVHVHHQPEGRAYGDVKTYAFGTEVPIPDPEMSLDTGRWPRDR